MVNRLATRASNPTGIDAERREKERQSLAKFEEFENTLMILENNKSEEEFDDLLNSFSANIRNPMSEKVRQSLDNLKKRHSIIGSSGGGGGGVEKQQQDELNHEKSIPKNGKYSEFGGAVRATEQIGRNGMVSSLMSSSSGSGSGERLLRRSRLFDDVNVISMAPDNNGDDLEYTDNKHATELNSTQTLNRKNQMHLDSDATFDTVKTDNNNISNYNTDEIPATTGGKANRDRFKTIRIFKKPPENAIQIPDPDDEHTPEATIQTPQYPAAVQRSATDAFATKNTNSPKHQQQQLSHDPRVAGEGDVNQFGAKKAAINTMTYKRSGLIRPRQLSGLVKRDPYMKSSSHELLSSEHETTTTTPATATSRQMQSKPVPQLKSPMGIKSKSIHNLSTAKISIAKPTAARSEYTSGIEQPTQQSAIRGQNLVRDTLLTKFVKLKFLISLVCFRLHQIPVFTNIQSSSTEIIGNDASATGTRSTAKAEVDSTIVRLLWIQFEANRFRYGFGTIFIKQCKSDWRKRNRTGYLLFSICLIRTCCCFIAEPFVG